jgi:hypothetical protein
MRVRRETAEHPFATLKMRMGATLPDEASAKGRHRDGATRVGLQSHSHDEHSGHPAAHGSDPGIAGPVRYMRLLVTVALNSLLQAF